MCNRMRCTSAVVVTNLLLTLLMGVGVTLVFLPLGLGLMKLITQLMESRQIAHEAQQAVQIIQQPGVPLHFMILHGLSVVLLAPVAEELIFRGVLYPAVKSLCHRHVALFSVAALFGIIHGNIAVVVPLTIFGVMLALLYERTGNLPYGSQKRLDRC